MQESLNNTDPKNTNVFNIENNSNSNIQIITNIAINQSLSNQSKKNEDLINENQNEINQSFNKSELQNSIDNIITENLREHSAIVGNINSRNNNKQINISLKQENKGTYSKRLSKQNYTYLNRFIDYYKRKEKKLSQMIKEQNENEKKTLTQKPRISRKSVELISKLKLNDNILERMNDEEKKTKDKIDKLAKKINKEREKKKKEIEKPNQFNIKITKMDNRFDKVYKEMMQKEEDLKLKINAFADMVKEYEMRECIFQPNIYGHNNKKEENGKFKKRVSSSEVTRRLYNDEIKNKRKKMNKLNEKYKLSFRPTISNKSVDLALKKREKMKLESEEKIKLKNKELDENN